MGVDRTSYLVYGFKFENEDHRKIFDDHYDELMEDDPYWEFFNCNQSDQCLIFDAMCGEYVYIGIKLAELDEWDDDISIEISEDEIYELKTKLNEYMKAWPDYVQNLCKGMIPKLYFFIHAY